MARYYFRAMKPDPSPEKILERIQHRLAALKKSERGAAEEAGLSAAAIRNIRDGKSKSPRLDTVAKLAPILETSVEWLAFGTGEEDTHPEGKPSQVTRVPMRLNLVPVSGRVAAGTWRDADEYAEDAFAPISAPVDPDYPRAQQSAWLVEGDSMDQADPPLPDGSFIVCGDWEDMVRAGAVIEDGLIVVVEQTRDGGHLREVSVKQIKLYEDRIEFQPRSSNPRHKSIVIPRDPHADDGQTVKILAAFQVVMRRSSRR